VVLPANIDLDATEKIRRLLVRYPGPYKVCLLIQDQSGTKKVMTNFLVSGRRELKTEIEYLLGKDSFRIEPLAP